MVQDILKLLLMVLRKVRNFKGLEHKRRKINLELPLFNLNQNKIDLEKPILNSSKVIIYKTLLF